MRSALLIRVGILVRMAKWRTRRNQYGTFCVAVVDGSSIQPLDCLWISLLLSFFSFLCLPRPHRFTSSSSLRLFNVDSRSLLFMSLSLRISPLLFLVFSVYTANSPPSFPLTYFPSCLSSRVPLPSGLRHRSLHLQVQPPSSLLLFLSFSSLDTLSSAFFPLIFGRS